MPRIAIIDPEYCKPSKCGMVCTRFCPQVKLGYKTIVYDESLDRVVINEDLCSGCGICVKKCPFEAIKIVNLPEEGLKECSHSYGPNLFRLYGLPIPVKGAILGIIGRNGVGKTTCLNILSGILVPNLGDHFSEAERSKVIEFYKGSPLQVYFSNLYSGNMKVVLKPQYVDKIPEHVSGKVGDLLENVGEKKRLEKLKKALELERIWSREIGSLSGGELQKVALAAALSRDVNVYLLDEPSAYLDVKERMHIAKVIREFVKGKTAIIVEHDLAVLDYLADYVAVIYGKPGVYGVVSNIYSAYNGINAYLHGYLKSENVRIRKYPITFPVRPSTEKAMKSSHEEVLKWRECEVNVGKFKLKIMPGECFKGEVIGIIGPNAIGKTTFIKFIAGEFEESEEHIEAEDVKISYKPQYLRRFIEEHEGKNVESILLERARSGESRALLEMELIPKLELKKLMERNIDELSGGELQKVAIVYCMVEDADVYLLDEPSAYLDIEERLTAVKMIRKIVEMRKKSAFIVEHDILCVDLVSDRMMTFSGRPGIEGIANTPTILREAMNMFLRDVDITFRRDPETGRPRANKPGSRLDREQKRKGEYYYMT
ncbi:ribosome biogenesis/translation initiation ATPase RLI [archaeon]|nr:MAG: ribosome biogenesis/translation initiation ATPase RLI [archaeon]RLG65242.1 MAG: ribosome biogenesis/translation initiation ATPase RLI [archaeon]